MTEDDIKKLQSTGGEHLAATEKNILGNDLHKLADYAMTLKNGRVDFILDNAGMFSSISHDLRADDQVSSSTVIWSTPIGLSSLEPVLRSSSTERRSPGSFLMSPSVIGTGMCIAIYD
jgi:hypothetical protein